MNVNTINPPKADWLSPRRLGILTSVTVISALAWAVMFDMAAMQMSMSGGADGLGPGMTYIGAFLQVWSDPPMAAMDSSAAMVSAGAGWSLGHFVMMLVMWQIMMVAMMLPTAVPVISTFADIQAAARAKGEATASAWVFAASYMIAWGGAALLIVLAQWLAVVTFGETGALAETAPLIAAAMLVVAGAYQWTRIKDVCLHHCQSPMQFILMHWREGHSGAVRMGIHHGIYCVGCCWAFMSLMFVAGTMNLVWMLGLTSIMVVEKIVPGGNIFGRIVGTLLIVGGVALATHHLI